jgi:class 3 adenylate cyclase
MSEPLDVEDRRKKLRGLTYLAVLGNYTPAGLDATRAAARLQSKTREFGTNVIVSAAALEKGRGSVGGALKLEPLGKTPLKGKAAPLEVYKLL